MVYTTIKFIIAPSVLKWALAQFTTLRMRISCVSSDKLIWIIIFIGYADLNINPHLLYQSFKWL